MTIGIEKPSFTKMAEKWSSSHVARQEIRAFTGGIVSPAYMANMDHLGLGPRHRIRIGRKIAYPVDSLVKWLEKRSEVIE